MLAQEYLHILASHLCPIYWPRLHRETLDVALATPPASLPRGDQSYGKTVRHNCEPISERTLTTQEEPDSANLGRLLGIDYGRKYIGLALSDPDRTIASPLKILRVKNPSEALHQIVDLARREEATALVIGLPLDVEGDEGPMAKEVKAWAKRLQLLCDLLIHFVDESLSSIEALETAKQLGKHRERCDHLAASLILQAFLRGQS